MKEGGDDTSRFKKDRHEAVAAKLPELSVPELTANIVHDKKFKDIAAAIATARDIKEKVGADIEIRKWLDNNPGRFSETKTSDLLDTIGTYQENPESIVSPKPILLAVAEELLRRFPGSSHE